MKKGDQIYHGCFTKNRDGTNRITEKHKACLIPTNNPFSKYSEDTPSGVKTRSQEKIDKLVKKENTIDILNKKKSGQYSEMVRSGRLRSTY